MAWRTTWHSTAFNSDERAGVGCGGHGDGAGAARGQVDQKPPGSILCKRASLPSPLTPACPPRPQGPLIQLLLIINESGDPSLLQPEPEADQPSKQEAAPATSAQQAPGQPPGPTEENGQTLRIIILQ